MKRKRIEAWCLVNRYGEQWAHYATERDLRVGWNCDTPGLRVVRLVEASPTAREEAAVVMAAERLVGKRWDSSWKSEAQKVCNAVARLQAARKRGRK